jgi:DNA-binding CsgD family transcriptional regulator
MVAELIELSSVIADIYDAALDPMLWQQVLANICKFVGGSSATLFWHDSALQQSQVLHLFNEDPHYTRLYFEKYMPMNPVFPAATFMPVGLVHGVNDIVPQDELEQTRFYKEWVEPQGITDVVAVNLEKGIARSALFNVRRDASFGKSDEKMRQRLSLLVPHLQRAVTIGRLFDRERAHSEALTTTLDYVEAAVFLVGADGAITFTNDLAKRLLDEAMFVSVRGSALHAVLPGADVALRNALAAAATGGAPIDARGVNVPLTDENRDRWDAHILPLTSGRRREAGGAHGAVAAVFVRKTAPNGLPPLESFAKVHNLTASEVQVLNAVLKVKGVEAMAEMLGLSQNTVKFHLRNLFRKTGTTRQVELVKLATEV